MTAYGYCPSAIPLDRAERSPIYCRAAQTDLLARLAVIGMIALGFRVHFAHVRAVLRLAVVLVPRAMVNLRAGVGPNLSGATARSGRRSTSWCGRGNRWRRYCGRRCWDQASSRPGLLVNAVMSTACALHGNAGVGCAVLANCGDRWLSRSGSGCGCLCKCCRRNEQCTDSGH